MRLLRTHTRPDAPRPGSRDAALARLLLTGATVGAVAAAVLVVPQVADGPERTGSLRAAVERTSGKDTGGPFLSADGHTHNHNDPATKNAVSRAGEVSPQAVDPTTADQARASSDYVARERALPDPRLRTVPVHARRTRLPRTRYAMAGGCYTLRAPGGRYAVRTADGLRLGKRRATGATPITFRATDLGTYLLYGTERDFVASPGARWSAQPSTSTEWTARKRGRRYLLGNGGDWLGTEGRAVTTSATRTRWRLTRSRGCARYPESQVDVTGRPHAGVSSFQEVRGYVDAHTHGMAFEFLGGAHCGRPWHPYGPAYALVDCADHTGGTNPLETFLSGEPNHDTVGWPTFQDWPAPESLTHEGTYYKWMERSWRSGQRLFVNLLVENNQLCKLYPPVNRPQKADPRYCDEMNSIRRQAQDMYDFQDYIDAQYGGPGQGWYRIVTSPWEARRVINAGKMAVVMGIETSVPFGCTFTFAAGQDIPACDADQIDRQLAEVHKLGVRQMELVNKFDNALSGIAGDSGETGVVVNQANKLETNDYWAMRTCDYDDPEKHDQEQYAAPSISPEQQDALFGAIGEVYDLTGSLQLYPPAPHCNRRGLTDLGTHLVDAMADRGMLIDPDHMSVKARDTLLDQLEQRRYSGAISSHSWSTPDAYPRIYDLGGYIAPYAGDSTGFVDKWRRHLGWANPKYYFGFGFGADINGLGAQGSPRGTDVANPVTYPFRGLNGVTVKQQRAGRRIYDINADGVAQYGLYPDWIEDIGQVAGGQEAAIKDDMARGAEAYLQTWERATGIAADSCRNPGKRVSVGAFSDRVRSGMSTRRVMQRVGQPWQRLGRTFTYCAKAGSRSRVEMTVSFTRGGKVTGVRRS